MQREHLIIIVTWTLLIIQKKHLLIINDFYLQVTFPRNACNIEIDLVDLKQIDTVFAAQIFFTGELIYCSDENVFIRERMKIYSMYVTLNEQRAEILDAIEKRGNVFD